MTTSVETYLLEGCGRCPLGGTPQCKVHSWSEELVQLRRIILECGLTEEMKWGVPCYTYQGNNIFLLSAFKDNCSVSFFKGVLLEDAEGVLVAPGKNSQASRVFRFTSVQQVNEQEDLLKRYIFEAIEVEKAGLQVEFMKNPEPIPEELQAKLDEDPFFRAAFAALTPGRQRGYILHISGAKQSATRASRVEKHVSRIMEGKGIHDRP